MRLSEQVGAERPSFGVECGGIPPQIDQNVLSDLLGQCLAQEQPPCECKHRTPVAPMDLGERVLLQPSDAHHQARITEASDVVVGRLLRHRDGHARERLGATCSADPRTLDTDPPPDLDRDAGCRPLELPRFCGHRVSVAEWSDYRRGQLQNRSRATFRSCSCSDVANLSHAACRVTPNAWPI